MHEIQLKGRPKEVYRGRIVRMVNQDVVLSDGQEKTFETAERAPGVRVFAVNNERILLTREPRHETGGWDVRMPGGKVFDTLEAYVDALEQPEAFREQAALTTAQEELEQEGGLAVDVSRFELVHTSVCGSTMRWDLLYFIARLKDDEAELPSDEVWTGEGEVTKPEWFSYKDVWKILVSGEIQEDRTAAVLFRFLAKELGK